METKRKKVKAKRGPRTMNERSGPKTKGTLLDYFVLSSSLKGGLEPLGRKRGACEMDLIDEDDLDPVEEIKRRRMGSYAVHDGAKSRTLVEPLGMESIPVCRKKTGTRGKGTNVLKNSHGIKEFGGRALDSGI